MTFWKVRGRKVSFYVRGRIGLLEVRINCVVGNQRQATNVKLHNILIDSNWTLKSRETQEVRS